MYDFEDQFGTVSYVLPLLLYTHLPYCAKGGGFDSRTVQTFVCLNILFVCIASECFYV
jgi:hypothetical protein